MNCLRRNDEAALLAAVAGALLLITGYNGARGVQHFFALLVDWLGSRPLLLGVAYVFVGIASLGGVAVLIGAYLIHGDRVRTGRLFVLLGSGAGLFTLVLFLLVNLRRQEFDYFVHVLPAVLGVAIGVAARFRAKAVPIL